MGDFNEQVCVDPQGMSSVLMVGGLIVSHVTGHGVKDKPSTFAGGHTCVDYTLISERLKLYLLDAGIEPFNQQIYSDHGGMFINLCLPGLFNHSLTTLASLVNRHFCTTNQKDARNYIQGMHKYLQEHLVLLHLEKLKLHWTIPLRKRLIKISLMQCFMPS